MDRPGTPAPADPRAVRLVDRLLAVGTAVAVLAGTARLGGRLDIAGALPLALWLGLLLLVRCRWPLAVLLLSVQAVVVFRTSGLTDAGWVWPVSAAYATLAADDRPGRPGLPWAAGVGLAELAFAATWDTTAGGATPREVLGSLGVEALWLAVLLAAATAYRNRLRWRAELDERLLRAARERDLEADRRIAEAHLEIARELHDVVGHTLTVVGIQLRVAAEVLDDSPEEARAALATAQQVRTEAVRDLRALVHVLRAPGGAAPEDPVAGVPHVTALVDRMRSAELDIRLETSGDVTAVPAPVSLAVHRIVQEALTNTVRHAGASRADVSVRCGRERVEVRVTDDGRNTAETSETAGHGVRGMDERVRALGGDFSAGPRGEGGGWVVRAAIPVPGFRS
ncbi:sensor histidine kinase [Streptomyces sp. 130]|uniref:sensor histidine kinase n=1 Tax=Streptomyces sp. 130 TaxID=2591006 RepID=UPI00118172DB|nr:sensor histidine kinase [Streptomyces sp. 130]TRV77009.1 sensor histidine kinase [Streptomyces sp. 130]